MGKTTSEYLRKTKPILDSANQNLGSDSTKHVDATSICYTFISFVRDCILIFAATSFGLCFILTPYESHLPPLWEYDVGNMTLEDSAHLNSNKTDSSLLHLDAKQVKEEALPRTLSPEISPSVGKKCKPIISILDRPSSTSATSLLLASTSPLATFQPYYSKTSDSPPILPLSSFAESYPYSSPSPHRHSYPYSYRKSRNKRHRRDDTHIFHSIAIEESEESSNKEQIEEDFSRNFPSASFSNGKRFDKINRKSHFQSVNSSSSDSD